MKNARRAYTMVELVLALATSTILLGGLASAMIIATKAMPDAKSPLTAAVDAAAAADQLATDLYTAHTITERTDTQLEFRVADRNADGCPEVIRYEWSGVAGTPLRRRYNDGLPQSALADVQEFDLDYDVRPLDSTYVPAANESVETLLASNIGPKYRTDWDLNSVEWVGQFFRPSLPGGATAWKITRVDLLLRANTSGGGSNDGLARVQIMAGDSGGRPTGSVLADANILERELPASYLWKSVRFAAPPQISAGSGACIVVKWLSDAQPLDVQYQTSLTAAADHVLVTTSNGGASWSTASTQGLLYRVYGTAIGSSRLTVPTLHTITSIRIKLRSGDNATSRVDTAIDLPNEPEVTGS